jgi:nitrate/TMAO reductase-like tetraheme cytochrome c subunit
MNLFFNAPQWVHLTMVVVGAVAGGAGAWFAWTHREAILTWLKTRDRRAKIALATVAGTAVLVGAGAGGYGFWYMEHENDFCLGCHVMTPSWAKFEKSEHSKLECHDCHRQSQLANARQLVMWIAERPNDIPKHAKVPTRICAECHIQKPGSDSTWKRIIATAGHRIHMASNDTALKNVQCVTCHGVEVHAFQPVDATCAQSGCHSDTKAKIVLGKMAGQTSLHCTGCHQFTRPVAENISLDSTKKAGVAGASQCMDCHEMRQQMKGFDPSKDKHAGLCGNCHNPHTDKKPEDSWKTCGNAGCHTKPAEETPFHKGIPDHALKSCQSCHAAHTWKAEGSSCLTCHKGLFADNGATPGAPAVGKAVGKTHGKAAGNTVKSTVTPTGAVAATQTWWLTAAHNAPKGASYQVPATPARRVAPTPGPSSRTAGERVTGPERPFKHKTHKDLVCTACHNSESRHGAVTVKTAADCQSCHHAADRARGCEGCHASKTMAQPLTLVRDVKLTVWTAPKSRSMRFTHPQHRALECQQCHTRGPELAVTKDCASCHTEHHDAARDCRACHQGVKAQHERSVHQGCGASGCHQGAEYQNMPTARQVCLSCHVDMSNHKRGGECADCHKMTTWSATAGLPKGS